MYSAVLGTFHVTVLPAPLHLGSSAVPGQKSSSQSRQPAVVGLITSKKSVPVPVPEIAQLVVPVLPLPTQQAQLMSGSSLQPSKDKVTNLSVPSTTMPMHSKQPLSLTLVVGQVHEPSHSSSAIEKEQSEETKQ